MAVHTFSDSASACDSPQQNSDVKFGDTLVAEKEGAVGVACLYPFAVSVTQGKFSKFVWDEITEDPNTLLTLVDSIRAAVAEATRLDVVTNPIFDKFKN